MKKIISIFAIALLSSFTSIAIFNRFFNNDHRQIGNTPSQSPIKLVSENGALPLGEDFTKAAEMTVHAVVHVKTQYQQQGFNDPIFNFFWGEQPSQQYSATGSGVIISADGYIVTNNHVVANANDIEITLNDKRTYTAKVIGLDPSTDLALLKIDEKGLPFVQYGNSDETKVGEWVLAVGNPFNLTSTVTAGIISAKGRNINILGGGTAIESFIQTDAAVNPGNSGGALVNTNGELIGINAAIASNTGSYAGYSFAIPITIVKKVVNDLLEFGTVQRAYLGVTIRDLDSKLASEKGIKEIAGIYVESTLINGAAEKAGIEANDIIIAIEGAKVNNVPELQELVGRHRPGDKVIFTIKRNGSEKQVEVTLRDKDGDIRNAPKSNIDLSTSLGATFEELTPKEKQRLGISSGLKVTTIGNGILKNAGVASGFIITKIDKTPINNINDVTTILKSKSDGVLFEGVYPNGVKAYYGIGLH
ncbi:MAG: Do family serine endopeptidase [Bacteroidota bacterium]